MPLINRLNNGDWTIVEARARLTELIKQAELKGPQTITRRGHRVAVILSAEEWERRTKRTGNLVDFFAASPLPGSGVDIRRRKERPRKFRA